MMQETRIFWLIDIIYESIDFLASRASVNICELKIPLTGFSEKIFEFLGNGGKDIS